MNGKLLGKIECWFDLGLAPRESGTQCRDTTALEIHVYYVIMVIRGLNRFKQNPAFSVGALDAPSHDLSYTILLNLFV